MSDDHGTDEDQAGTVESAAEALSDESQARLWVRTLTPLLQMRSTDSDPSDRVQFAFDRVYVAACERMIRVLGSDLRVDRENT